MTTSYPLLRDHSVDLSAKRRTRRVVENDDYAAFTSRVIRAQGRRIATGDVEGLADLLALEDEVAQALRIAVIGLRTAGFSWAEIAARIGTTRQAAHQRWGDTATSTRPEQEHSR